MNRFNGPSNQPNEGELIRRAQGGEKEAFGDLVELHQDRVYNFSFHLTGNRDRAWDLSQEAFLKAFAAIASFRGGSRFYTWIYRILLNLHMNKEKSMGRRMEKRSLSMNLTRDDNHRSALGERLAGPGNSDPSSEVLRKERKAAVQEAISQLAADQKQVVLLRDMEGLSYEEIADLLEIPVGTVRSRLHRAREELKRRLERIW